MSSSTSCSLRNLGGLPAGGERQPWDFQRFVKTVLFFNPPPPPQEVLRSIVEQPGKILRAMSGEATVEDRKSAVLTVIAPNAMGPIISGSPAGSSSAASEHSAEQGVVMVAGATGGVGKRVVALLLERGRRVRALVRDVEKARGMLSGLSVGSGGSLELVAADITQRRTLLPEMFRGVTQLISCTAVKVAPKEGDTADRSKYYQGIKFYDPEIIGDTPEAVEYRGIQNLLDAVKEHLGEWEGKLVFSPDGRGPVAGWGALDDVVMGGVSSSGFFIRPGVGEDGSPAGVFTGTVTTANNGGFASVRTRNLEPPLDLSAYEGLELRVKGDGLRYKLVLRSESAWDGIGYTASFDTTAGGLWQSVRLPFSSFVPVFRARSVLSAAPLDASRIYSIQLMLSKFEYDSALNPSFREGLFELPLQRVSAYMREPLVPRVVLVSSAGVTRPNRPGINVDLEPPAVKLNDTLGGILTYKLKGEDVVRGSGVPFAIVRPVALTEEPAGAELQLDQGDTIRGKISREDVAQLCVELLQQPAAANTTFEIKSTVPFSTPFAVDAASPPAPRDWRTLLESARLRQRVTGKTIRGVYTGTEPEPEDAEEPATVGAA
ncbi:hypothetical protein N2152v2_011209 [Parachlorella kessleri]